MAKFVMNKNVKHSGIDYEKGSAISESADGFKSMRENGHIDEYQAPVESNPKVVVADDESESEEKSVEHSKPAKPARK